MSRYIDNIKWSVRRLTNSDAVGAAIDALFETLEKENKARNNFEAFVNVRQIESKEIDLPEEGYGETWEVLTGHFTYEHEDGHWEEVECLVSDFDEKKEELEEELEAKISDLEDDIGLLESDISESEDLIDELEELIAEGEDREKDLADARAQLVFEQQKLAKLEDRLTAAEDSLISLQRSDFEYDEIMWNTLYQYDGEVDYAAACACGLAIVRVNDEEYLGLTGCGMDLSPKFFCYQALACGGIAEGMAYKLKSNGPDYFKHCVSTETFERSMAALGISEYVDSIQEDLNARMKAFDENIKKISSSYDEGIIGKDQRNFLAVMALGAANG